MDAPEHRIATVPNLVTVLRLACLPVFVWLLALADEPLAAAGLLAALGATDWLDGFLARKMDQVSALGKVLDPVADRLLFLVGVGTILLVGAAPRWFCIVVLAREAVVSAATLVLAGMGARRIDVSWLGKAGTFTLMFAFPLFVAASADTTASGVLEAIAWCFAAPGLALSLAAAVAYIPAARAALAEGREAAAALDAVDAG